MKKLVLTTFIIILLIGCMPVLVGTRYQYKYSLIGPKSNDGMSYEDSVISISFTITDKSINFNLTNKTKNVIKIIWNDASIVQFGKAHKVMHAGVKYINRNEFQPPTSIPPKSSIDDLALPSDNVYFQEGYYGTYFSTPGGWKEQDLFITNDMNKQEYKELIKKMKGQKFSLYLPIEYKGKILDYNFEFIIKDVKPIKQ